MDSSQLGRDLFLAELAALEVSLLKHQLVHEMNAREVQKYEIEKSRIGGWVLLVLCGERQLLTLGVIDYRGRNKHGTGRHFITKKGVGASTDPQAQ